MKSNDEQQSSETEKHVQAAAKRHSLPVLQVLHYT